MSHCLICGRKRGRGHHPTGKACLWRVGHADGRGCGCFLDPDLVVPVCHDHHMLCHDDWHTLGIAQPEREATWIDRVELRLRRVAGWLARMDEARGGGTLFGIFAAAVVRWADELRRFIHALDAYAPRWREHRAFYPAGPTPIPEG